MNRISKGSFVHLMVQSDYGHGSCNIKDVIDKAVEYRMPAVALTDFGTLGGAVEFQNYAARKGIKSIVGCSLDIRDNSVPHDGIIFTATLLATAPKGYLNLCKLISSLGTKSNSEDCTIDRDFFLKHCSGLICIADHIIEPSTGIGKRMGKATLMEFRNILSEDNLYLSIMPPHSSTLRKVINKKTVAYARELGIPVVAKNCVCYLSPEDAKLHEIHNLIRTDCVCRANVGDIPDPYNQHCFKSMDAMRKLFEKLPEAADNTLRIAERCNFNFTTLRKEPPYAISNSPAKELKSTLLSECRKGLNIRYPGKPAKAAETRMLEELKIINDLSLAGQFLFLKNVCDYARAQDMQIMADVQAAGTMIAYLLGIGLLDPLKYGFVFERCINPIRRPYSISMRLLCSQDDRDKLLMYLSREYDNMTIPLRYRKYIQNSALDEIFLKKGVAQFEPGHRNLVISAAPDKAAIAIRPHGFQLPLPVDNSDGAFPIIQFPIYSCERLGMLNLEIMPLSVFSLMKRIVEHARLEKGKVPSLDQIDYSDPKVFDIFSKGDTDGIWEFGTRAMKELCIKTGVKEIRDLIALYALSRPGTEMLHDEYFRRKSIAAKFPSIHLLVDRIIGETCGMIVYQEQVLQILSEMGGFSLAESDIIRKCICVKSREELASAFTKFIIGCLERTMSPGSASQLWNALVISTSCAHLKSLSAGHAMLAYRMAWLKTYFRKSFDYAAKDASGMEDEYERYFNEEA